MKKHITRVSPISLGKTIAVIQGGITFVFAALAFITAVWMTLAFAQVQARAIFVAFFVMVIIPLIQAILGFILGAIAGWIYNLSVHLTGGIHITLAAPERSHDSVSEESQSD